MIFAVLSLGLQGLREQAYDRMSRGYNLIRYRARCKQPDVMNVEEVADLPGQQSDCFCQFTVLEAPAVKVGREWRFRRDAVLAALNKGCREEGATQETPFYRVARGGLKEGLSVRDGEIIEKHIKRLTSK